MSSTKRRRSREAAFQTLYAIHFTEQDLHQASTLIGSVADDEIRSHDQFSAKLLETLDANRDHVDAVLAKALDRWSPERLSAPDRALLRLGVTELLYFDDIPPRATLNEYIELAKLYGDTESPRFVNGILDRVYRELKSASKPNEGNESNHVRS